MTKIDDFSQFWDWKFPIDLREKKNHRHRNFFYSELLYELTKIFISGIYDTKSKVQIAAHNVSQQKILQKKIKERSYQ